jgi:GntR family transcriptional regulator
MGSAESGHIAQQSRMIRLWISHRASVPIREQLGAQLLLGILSRRLAPGERLPSVRDLARRLKIHANTVSAVYQDLGERGWVQARRGSGVFVNLHDWHPNEAGIDGLVSAWIEEAQARGFSVEELQSAFGRLARQTQPRKLLVVDPDPDLAAILAAEIAAAIGQPVAATGCDQSTRTLAPDTCVLVNSGHASRVAESLGDTPFRLIQLRSMQEILEGRQRPVSPVLIAVVSRSESILAWASTLLSALGFEPDSVLQRNPRQPAWQDGLAACDIVSADVVTAVELPEHLHPLVFRIVSDQSLAEVRQLVTV